MERQKECTALYLSLCLPMHEDGLFAGGSLPPIGHNSKKLVLKMLHHNYSMEGKKSTA